VRSLAAKIAEAKAADKIAEAKVAEKITEAKVADKVTEAKLADKITEAKVADKVTEAKVPDKLVDTKISDVIVIPPGSTSAPGDYSQSSNCVPPGGGTLQPGQACTITVNFTPSATGIRSAYLLITHNAAGSLNSIALTGSGILQSKLRDVKITDVKTFDRIIGGKISETILSPRFAMAPTGALNGATQTPVLKSFITPQERPALGLPASGATPASDTAKPQ
jgi:hypothetical protein